MKLRKANTPLIVFLLGSLIAGPFLSVYEVFPQSGLKTYTEGLLKNLENEIDTINNFLSALNAADFDTELGISSFRTTLRSHKNDFQKFLVFYQSSLPAEATDELSDAINTVISGTEQVLKGIEGIDRALGNRSNSELQQAQKLLNAGTQQVNSAITKYNSWVDKHNARVRTESPARATTKDIGLESAFDNTWHYAKPLFLLYLYLFVAGLVLSFAFRQKLKELTTLKSIKFRGTPFYGLHLLLLFPYLYALLLFCLLIVWDIALITILYVTSAGRIHLGIVIGLVTVVCGTTWAILKGFFAAKKRSILGTAITRAEQPIIWDSCDKIAKQVGTKTVDEIYISPQPGIGVHLSGGLFSMLIGRTKRTLTIGMPSISSLSISEMEAILAHEFGHFSNKDTSWNSLTFTMAGALQNTLSTMPNPWKAGDYGWIKFVIALNPALWILLAYRYLFAVVTSGFSRMREVLADKTAIALYGWKNFTDALMKVARNDCVFSKYFVPQVVEMLTKEGRMYTNVFNTMDETYRSIENAKLSEIDKSILAQETSSMFDSHPLLKERLAYARHFEVQQHKTEMAEFKTRFKNWDDVSKKMSDLYVYYICVLTGYKFHDTERTQEK